jgi:glycine dehydrogenase subunit 1
MRYLPLSSDDRAAMLDRVGVSTVDELFTDIPEEKRLNGFLNLPRRKGELEVERAFQQQAAKT